MWQEMAVYATLSRVILEAAEMVPGEKEKFSVFQRMTITLIVYSCVVSGNMSSLLLHM